MATTLTRNLKLRLDSNLTANAKYNLSRLDLLGAVFNLDNSNNSVIRSMQSISIRPNDASIGGSGIGGDVTIGSADQPLDSISFHADVVSTGAGGLALSDAAAGGNKTLSLVYDSSLSGSVDTAGNRTLLLDLNGADRQLILSGNLSLLGSGNLSLSLSGNTSWSLPASNSAGFLSNDGSGTLSWIPASGAGTVTSVGLTASSPLQSSGSPITSSGSFTLGFADQAANTVLAGPTSGADDAPSFRALIAEDLNQIVGYRALSETWTSGTTLTVTHNWNTRKILVEVLDADNDYREIIVDDESRPTDNTVVLQSNTPPSGAGWVVLLKEVP